MIDEAREQEFRERLEALRVELREALAAEQETTKPVSPDRAIGRLTRQDAMLAQQMALEMRRRNEARLQQIDGALERLEEGSYGECTRCGEPIGEARLRARPEAGLCIGCAGGRRV